MNPPRRRNAQTITACAKVCDHMHGHSRDVGSTLCLCRVNAGFRGRLDSCPSFRPRPDPHCKMAPRGPTSAPLFRAALAHLFLCGCTAQTNVAQRVVLSAAAASNGAVCLDGTPAVLYFRAGAEPTKFVILQLGGGWCLNDVQCAGRSSTNLGSSKNYPATLDLSAATDPIFGDAWGMLSDDPARNPQLHNHTRVFLPYCDGGS